jgi:predicted acyltransferase
VLAWLSILKRSFLLFFIGFLLQIKPFEQPHDTWRIVGILQRIGLCFLLVTIMIAMIKERWLLFLLVRRVPCSLENNLVRHVDIAILGSTHMWRGKGIPFDPEGLFSSISTSITVLSGYLMCAKVLQQKT